MFSAVIPLLFLSNIAVRVVGQNTNSSDGDETVRAVFIFHNACLRTSYTAASSFDDDTNLGTLTGAGANQCHDSGTFYRNRYLAGNSNKQIQDMTTNYNLDEFVAFAPSNPLFAQGGTAFLQGLYPPLETSDIFGNNTEGDADDAPLQGYQYAILNTVPTADPRTTLVRGRDLCPNAIADSNLYYGTNDFLNLMDSTQVFYNSLYSKYLAGVFDEQYINYGSAYDIYDYISSNPSNTTLSTISSADLALLRYYASVSEFNRYANLTTSPDMNWMTRAKEGLALRDIAARTLSTNVLETFMSFINNPSQNKFTFVMGDYTTFLSFAGIANLTEVSSQFESIPEFGASMVFELVSTSYDPNRDFDEQTDGLKVRFGFRNATSVSYYALFGPTNDLDMTWADFRDNMGAIGMTNYLDWCSFCQSRAVFCRADDNFVYNITVVQGGQSKSDSSMSLAVAGVIGAIVTLAVTGIIAALVFFLCGFAISRKKKENHGNVTRTHRRNPSFMLNLGRSQKMEKAASDMELALSPRAAGMGQRMEDDQYPDDDDFKYNTMSSTATAVQLQKPGQAVTKEPDLK